MIISVRTKLSSKQTRKTCPAHPTRHYTVTLHIQDKFIFIVNQNPDCFVAKQNISWSHKHSLSVRYKHLRDLYLVLWVCRKIKYIWLSKGCKWENCVEKFLTKEIKRKLYIECWLESLDINVCNRLETGRSFLMCCGPQPWPPRHV